ncbi:hypothetical protein QR680_007783 [Steinernema hermaphroditum]|uniref:Uncharacterized protein n=1 Tax=Steinernema hermaphroditum TaxID=289476 RepID=A0AA39IFT8_9BILA|nr:hypothetical protein QR680_007783 [Steinernema hermaphroditum]
MIESYWKLVILISNDLEDGFFRMINKVITREKTIDPRRPGEAKELESGPLNRYLEDPFEEKRGTLLVGRDIDGTYRVLGVNPARARKQADMLDGEDWIDYEEAIDARKESLARQEAAIIASRRATFRSNCSDRYNRRPVSDRADRTNLSDHSDRHHRPRPRANRPIRADYHSRRRASEELPEDWIDLGPEASWELSITIGTVAGTFGPANSAPQPRERTDDRLGGFGRDHPSPSAAASFPVLWFETGTGFLLHTCITVLIGVSPGPPYRSISIRVVCLAMEETDHPKLYLNTHCCGSVHFRRLLVPLFVLSLLASISLSVLITIQWGWGMLFVIGLGLLVYIAVFICLFYGYKPKTLIPTFAIFEVSCYWYNLSGNGPSHLNADFSNVIGIIHISDKYSHSDLMLLIYGAVYIPIYIPAFIIYCWSYVYTDWDCSESGEVG